MKLPSRLEAEELADLAGQFRLSAGLPPETSAASPLALRCSDLLNGAACANYLDGLGGLLRSPSV